MQESQSQSFKRKRSTSTSTTVTVASSSTTYPATPTTMNTNTNTNTTTTAPTTITIPGSDKEISLCQQSTQRQYINEVEASTTSTSTSTTSNDEAVVAQLAAELMAYVSPTPSVVSVQATPIPLLTPPSSPLSSNLEWPSNLAVDNALTAAATAAAEETKDHWNVQELEEECDFHKRHEPFVQIVFPRNWHGHNYNYDNNNGNENDNGNNTHARAFRF